MENMNTNVANTETENALKGKAAEVMAKIEQVKATATQADKDAAALLVSRAATHGTDIIEMTPAMAAILFIEHNGRNRDWRAARSESYARQMEKGEWKLNGQTIQFYKDGKLSDGQHRAAGCAISGETVLFSVFFGMDKDEIITIDSGTRRTAADALELDGVLEAKLMEACVKAVNAYEVKIGKAMKLESNTEIMNEVKAQSSSLKTAIDIGNASVKNITNPLLKSRDAAVQAYLLIKNGWNAQRVMERLAYFQAGHFEADREPLALVADAVYKSNEGKSKETLSAQKKMALLTAGMIAAEEGVKSVTKKFLSDSIKEFPQPKPTVSYQ